MELCALGFELLGILFFLSLLGCFLSSSAFVGDLLKKLETFRSLVGVVTSGSPSNLSWLVGAEAACDEGAKEPVVVVDAIPSDEGPMLRPPAAAAGDKPRGAVACVGVLCGDAYALVVGDGEPGCFCSRLLEGIPGDLFDGTVLLRWTPPLVVLLNEVP